MCMAKQQAFRAWETQVLYHATLAKFKLIYGGKPTCNKRKEQREHKQYESTTHQMLKYYYTYLNVYYSAPFFVAPCKQASKTNLEQWVIISIAVDKVLALWVIQEVHRCTRIIWARWIGRTWQPMTLHRVAWHGVPLVVQIAMQFFPTCIVSAFCILP